MWDSAAIISNQADLTADATGSAFDLLAGGTGQHGIETCVFVESAGGTSPTLDIRIETSDTSGFSTVREKFYMPQITAAGVYAGPTVITHYRYIRAVFDVGGTSPDFDRVTMGIVTGNHAGDQDPF